jgi:hypothetical protein
MRILCRCGHLIVDIADALPYKATIIPDTLWNDMMEWEYKVAEFVLAKAEGNRDAWIIQTFGEQYPRDMHDREIVIDLLSGYFIRHGRDTAHQCESCGRLWLMKPSSDRLCAFKPEDDDWHGIFDVRRP